jgi:hypothetical protein
MKYVKENLDVVIILSIALVALVLVFYPTASWGSELKERMQERFNQRNAATSLISTVEIIPGSPKLQGVTIEKNLIDAKKYANENMKQQAERIQKLAAEQNSKHRVQIVKGAPGTPDKYIPLLADDKPQDNYLPAPGPVRADPFGFKIDYERQFATWLEKLKGGTPPTANEVAALVEARRLDLANQEKSTARIFPGGGAGGAGTLSQKETATIKKAAVYSRAAKLHCYVDENALQRREWFGKPVPPNEAQIFEAVVDSWFQQDVVNAIIALNKSVLDLQPADKRNVGRSPLKRLESIVIGAAATGAGGGGSGALFIGGAPNPAAGGGPAPVPAVGGTTAAGLDFTRSLTGHVGTAEYDVVPLRIVVHIDPAYINQFIDTLYRQNNGYTVINQQIRVDDPLEASSNGFLYGPVQVVRLELLVEGLLFRSWTVPIMPDTIRRGLGLPPVGTPVPGAGIR